MGRERTASVAVDPEPEPLIADAASIANLERQLLAAHAASVVSSLAGGVAHHFNNLLSGMLGLVTLAPNLDRDALMNLSERLREKIEHASRLTQVLLSITRHATHEEANATCELTSRTREVIVLAGTSCGPAVTIESELPDGELWARISPLTYSRGLLNLLVSPIELTDAHDGHHLEVKLTREDNDCVLAVDSSVPAPAGRDHGRIVEALLAGEPVDPLLLSRAAVGFALQEAGGSITFHERPGGSSCVVRVPVVPGL